MLVDQFIINFLSMLYKDLETNNILKQKKNIEFKVENELNSLSVICNYGTEKDNIYFKLNKCIKREELLKYNFSHKG